MTGTMTAETAREVLGVDEETDPERLHQAYRQRARQVHPDVGGSAEAFAELQAAYLLLATGHTEEGRAAAVEVSTWAGLYRALRRSWAAVAAWRRLAVVALVFVPLWGIWGAIYSYEGAEPVRSIIAIYLVAVMIWWVVREVRRPKVQPLYWIFVPSSPNRAAYMDRLKKNPPPEV